MESPEDLFNTTPKVIIRTRGGKIISAHSNIEGIEIAVFDGDRETEIGGTETLDEPIINPQNPHLPELREFRALEEQIQAMDVSWSPPTRAQAPTPEKETADLTAQAIQKWVEENRK